MSTAIDQTEVYAVRVEVSDDVLVVALKDGRIISAPVSWYPRLAYANDLERSNYELPGEGIGIHWPLLDEDILVTGLLEGRKSAESAASFESWKKELEKQRSENYAAPWGKEIA